MVAQHSVAQGVCCETTTARRMRSGCKQFGMPCTLSRSGFSRSGFGKNMAKGTSTLTCHNCGTQRKERAAQETCTNTRVARLRKMTQLVHDPPSQWLAC